MGQSGVHGWFAYRGRWLARLSAVGRIGLAFALIGFAGGATAEIDRERARTDMREIYASIRVLVPLSADEDAFGDPKNRELIREALSKLAARSQHVADHVSGEVGARDLRIQYLAGSLSRESVEALQRFDEGLELDARFFVQQLPDFCVACHTALPSPMDSPLAQDFVSDKELARLAPGRRAMLQVATRRFDDALSSYETLFASPVVHPAELLHPLTQYLTVAIRVKNDLTRPVPVLEKLGARPDLWRNLQTDVDRWVETLKSYASEPPREVTLESAREPLDAAAGIIGFPTDRQVLVHYLVASSRFHRYLERHSEERNRDVAEAYYWLGLIESRVGGSYWVSEFDFYLETAIRLAPSDPMAQQAFALYEEEAILGWTGSSGNNMPAEVRRRIEQLRSLVYPK
jgi:hypothetical protein